MKKEADQAGFKGTRTGTESLSARELRSAYFPDGNFLNAQLGARPSNIWRAIMDGKDISKQGLNKRNGTGEQTNAWNQNWIPRNGALGPITGMQETD